MLLCNVCMCTYTCLQCTWWKMHKAIAVSPNDAVEKASQAILLKNGAGPGLLYKREGLLTEISLLTRTFRLTVCVRLSHDQDVAFCLYVQQLSCGTPVIIYVKMRTRPSYLYGLKLYRIEYKKQENCIASTVPSLQYIYKELRLFSPDN